MRRKRRNGISRLHGNGIPDPFLRRSLMEGTLPEAGKFLPSHLQAQKRTRPPTQDNNFKTKIELYQARVDYHHRDKNLLDHFCEKMELDNEPTFLQDFSTLVKMGKFRRFRMSTITKNCCLK